MSGLAFFGLFTGIFILVLCICFAIRRRKGTFPAKFDERQQWLHGRAYRSAFWVLVAYLCANGFSNLVSEAVWADAFTTSLIGICLAITVFIVICINRDAYFPVNQQPKFYLVLLSILMLIQLALGIIRLLRDSNSFFTGGVLNYNIINFVVFAMFAVMIAALLIQRQKSKSVKETD